MLAHLWDAVPEPLRDPVALAVPFFLLLVAVEGLRGVPPRGRPAGGPAPHG